MGCGISVPSSSREFSKNRRRGKWSIWDYSPMWMRDKYDRHIDHLGGVGANTRKNLKAMDEYLEYCMVRLRKFEKLAKDATNDIECNIHQRRAAYILAHIQRFSELAAQLDSFDAIVTEGVALEAALVTMKDIDSKSIAGLSKNILKEGTENLAALFEIIKDGEKMMGQTFAGLGYEGNLDMFEKSLFGKGVELEHPPAASMNIKEN